MSLTLMTPPAAVPISLAEAKAQCNLDLAESDALVVGFVRSATDFVEAHSGLRLIEQTWAWTVDAFPDRGGWLRLPLAPLMSITSITWLDALGVQQTLPPATYLVIVGSTQPARVLLAPNAEWPTAWPGLDVVTITAVYGFGANWNDVPESLRQAIAMLVGYWFAQREAASIGPDSGPVSDVPFSVNRSSRRTGCGLCDDQGRSANFPNVAPDRAAGRARDGSQMDLGQIMVR